MPVLAIDTSARVAVALTDEDGSVLAGTAVEEQRGHAELLAPMIVDVLGSAGAEPRDITSVVVGTGPAPFTGLRAGLVTARAFAFARGVPALGVCSLDALAAEAFAGGAAGEVLVVADARRREVYWARYRLGANGLPLAINPPTVGYPDAVDTAAAVVVGGGAALYPEAFAGAVPPLGPDPAFLARLALLRAARGEALPTEPLYLRRPDAVPAGGRKRATG